MKKLHVAAAFAGAFLAAVAVPGSAVAQTAPDGSELRGATLLAQSSDGTVNTVSFHPDGTATIASPSGLVTVQGRWFVQNNQLCLEVAADRRECWGYVSPFQVGQEVVLTSDCPATTRWTAQTLAAPPLPPVESSGERGERG